MQYTQSRSVFCHFNSIKVQLELELLNGFTKVAYISIP